MSAAMRTRAAVLCVTAILAWVAPADARLLCSTQVRLVRTYQLQYEPKYQPLLEPAGQAAGESARTTAVPRLGAVTRYNLEIDVPRIEPTHGTVSIGEPDGPSREQTVLIPSLVPASVSVEVSLPDFGSKVVDVKHDRLVQLNASYARDVARAANLLAGCLPRQLGDVRERVDAAFADAISAWRDLAVRLRGLPPGAVLVAADGEPIDAEAILEVLRDQRLQALSDLVWLSAGISHARQAAERVERLRRF